MMAASYLTVPLKKTFEVDVEKPLKNLIAANYSTADNPVDCSEALKELTNLRNNAVCKPLDKHDKSLETINRYYDQLNALESKVTTGDLQIPFKWRDAFDKGSFFGGKMTLTLSSISYEKACVLFNIAALESQIAANQDFNFDEGLKSAAKHFQMSSGIFLHLKNCANSSIQQEPTPDMSTDVLSALHQLMMNQAQEVFFQKATADEMKNAIVSKIAMQLEEGYGEVVRLISKESIKQMWDKDWIAILAAKQLKYEGLAHYHQALVAKDKQSFGEVLSRLQHAMSVWNDANAKGQGLVTIDSRLNRAKNMYDETKKDNDFIYHEQVLNVKALTPIGKALLIKPTELPQHLSSKFTDLFEVLLPVQVHQSLSLYDIRKNECVNQEVNKLREATQLMNGALASFNLPAALEDSSGSELPQSIIDKSSDVQSKGGVAAIDKLLADIPELLQRNSEILNEIEKSLKDEEDSDNQLRSQFKEKWTRTSSSSLNESLKRDYSKYRQLMNNAISADNTVREKFNLHNKWISALSHPVNELKSAIPSCGQSADIASNPIVHSMKQLMEQVDQIKAERDVIESELKSATTDMKERFLKALVDDGGINEEVISMETIGHVYGPLQKQASQNIQSQQQLMGRIQQTNAKFCEVKGQNQSAAQREAALKDIAAAYDAFIELMANLQEGTKFYNDLTQLLVAFQNKVSDYCFARKTEKDELCKDLQHDIVRQPSQPTPSIPQHHRPAVPERPPPPTAAAPKPTPAPRTSTGPPANAPGYPPSAAAASNPPYPNANPPMPNPPYPAYPYPQAAPPLPSGYNPYGQPAPYAQYPGQYPPAPSGYPGYGQPQAQQQQPQQQPPYAYQQYPGNYPPQYPGQWR